jgi:hypothetical protein
MEGVRSFEVMYEEFSVVNSFTSGNNAQKWMIKFRNANLYPYQPQHRLTDWRVLRKLGFTYIPYHSSPTK